MGVMKSVRAGFPATIARMYVSEGGIWRDTRFEAHVGGPGSGYEGQHEQVSSQEAFLHKRWFCVDAICVTSTLTRWYR